jgi:hypothetical protein
VLFSHNASCSFALWMGRGSPCSNISQFLEAVQDIHTQSLGSDTPEKDKAEFILDLFRILEFSGDNIDNVVEFFPFKLVGNLDERPIVMTNLCLFKA